jgi:glucose/arabinose dehydrogenase
MTRRRRVWWVIGGIVAGFTVSAFACSYVALPFGWTVNFPGFSGDPIPASEVGSRLAVPDGFAVDEYASGIENARFLRFTPMGDLLVSAPRQGKVFLVEADRNGDGRADGKRVLLEGLNQPHGMVLRDGWLYVAETDALLRVHFDPATRTVSGPPERIVTGLPGGGNHWTRTIGFGPDGRLYVSIGSSCNVCIEKDRRRAAIVSYDADGKDERVVATGLRNSVGFAWQPGTNALYATDNGRDLLGDEFPPCELNRIVEGGFYGWPIANGDRVPDPDFGKGREKEIAASTPPVHGFPAHTAPLGIAFYDYAGAGAFPEAYRGDAFVALHGSWNRSKKIGYEVVSLEFRSDGTIDRKPFLTGFLNGETGLGTTGRRRGRPRRWALRLRRLHGDDLPRDVRRVGHGRAPRDGSRSRCASGDSFVGDPSRSARRPELHRAQRGRGARARRSGMRTSAPAATSRAPRAAKAPRARRRHRAPRRFARSVGSRRNTTSHRWSRISARRSRPCRPSRSATRSAAISRCTCSPRIRRRAGTSPSWAGCDRRRTRRIARAPQCGGDVRLSPAGRVLHRGLPCRYGGRTLPRLDAGKRLELQSPRDLALRRAADRSSPIGAGRPRSMRLSGRDALQGAADALRRRGIDPGHGGVRGDGGRDRARRSGEGCCARELRAHRRIERVDCRSKVAVEVEDRRSRARADRSRARSRVRQRAGSSGDGRAGVPRGGASASTARWTSFAASICARTSSRYASSSRPARAPPRAAADSIAASRTGRIDRQRARALRLGDERHQREAARRDVGRPPGAAERVLLLDDREAFAQPSEGSVRLARRQPRVQIRDQREPTWGRPVGLPIARQDRRDLGIESRAAKALASIVSVTIASTALELKRSGRLRLSSNGHDRRLREPCPRHALEVTAAVDGDRRARAVARQARERRPAPYQDHGVGTRHGRGHRARAPGDRSVP